MRTFLLFLLFCPALCQAQADVVKRSLEAQRVPTPPTIDGKLDDAVWVGVPVATGFVQNRPNPGMASGQNTEMKVVYDDDAIYKARTCTTRLPTAYSDNFHSATTSKTPIG